MANIGSSHLTSPEDRRMIRQSIHRKRRDLWEKAVNWESQGIAHAALISACSPSGARRSRSSWQDDLSNYFHGFVASDEKARSKAGGGAYMETNADGHAAGALRVVEYGGA